MNTTTVTTPNELEIRVERIFDAPGARGRAAAAATARRVSRRRWPPCSILKGPQCGEGFHLSSLKRCRPSGTRTRSG